MVLTLTKAFLALLPAAAIGLSGPAWAHKDHDEKAKAAAAAQAAATVPPEMAGQPASLAGSRQAMTEHMEDMARAAEDATPKSWPARILDWIGRVHPFAVHFPLALFPVAWLALLLARRRGDAVDVIRALILVAGASAAVAGILGWLDAGFALAEDDWLLRAHRWMGTGLGVTGAAIAAWAWRRSSSVNSKTMVWLLGLVTLALLAQGWFGGALVHGVDHMNM